jgi:prepilin-type N-terminal cleavage/methylation domain-containing protein
MKTRGGFTLIEVLVALGILGVAMFVLLDSHYSALRMQSATMDEIELRSLVELAVAEAEVGILTNNLVGEGDFGERYRQYRYKYETELQGEENVPLFRVTVTVTHEERGDTTLDFFVFHPS